MPVTIPTEPGTGLSHQGAVSLESDQGYSYPDGLDWRPSGELHKNVLQEITRRAQASYAAISQKHDTWNEIDRVLTAYVCLDKEEKEVRAKDRRKPVSIVVPLSFATLEVLLTYWMSANLTRPMFTYEGTGPEDQLGAMLLELVVDQQMQRSAAGLATFTAGRDMLAYGMGIMTPTWHRHEGFRTALQPTGFYGPDGQFYQTGEQRASVPAVLYEGNRLDTIDPRAYLPDVSAPLTEPQRGEYVGWVRRENFHDLLAREQAGADGLFNVRYLKGGDYRSTIYWADARGANNRTGDRSLDVSASVSQPVDVTFMYQTLIPRDWKMGTSERPEKWMFAVAGDRVIIGAKRLGLNHNMFPVGVASPEYDGRSMLPVSRMEVIYGLQHLIDFLINSHTTNVRKALNDMWLIDPLSVNVNDLKDPEPGKIIRTRPAAWGKGVDGFVKQFPVSDVTGQHIPHAEYIDMLMQKTSGAQDITMGIMRSKSGQRRTGQEVEAAQAGALSRLNMANQVAGLQMFHPLAYMLASQTQQLMSEEVYVRIAGRFEQELREIHGLPPQHKVGWRDLLCDYDVTLRNSSLGVGEHVEDFQRAIEMASTNPLLAQEWSVSRLYRELLRRMDIKDASDFRNRLPGGLPPVNVQVMPDEQALAQAERGNLVPIDGLGGGGLGA